MEVEGRKGDTILTGADELYHDEAFRAKASPFQPAFNVNNFFEICICKPENFLTGADEPYNDEAFRAKTTQFPTCFLSRRPHGDSSEMVAARLPAFLGGNQSFEQA